MTGNEIKKERLRRGLTQKEAANICGRSQAWLANLERYGKKRIPAGSLAAVSKLLPVGTITAECKQCQGTFEKRHGNHRYCDDCGEFAKFKERKISAGTTQGTPYTYYW